MSDQHAVIDFGDPKPHDGSHLTDTQARTIEAYAAEIRDALHLGHWRVHVSTDLPEIDDALASVHPTDGRRIAMLAVSEQWWDRSAEDKRTDITHEMLHLAHHDTDEHIRRFFDGTGDVSDYVASLVVEQFKMNLERMVDSLSYVLAPHMPGWPEEDE